MWERGPAPASATLRQAHGVLTAQNVAEMMIKQARVDWRFGRCPSHRHCEERSDAAIHLSGCHPKMDCRVAFGSSQ